jgi:putative transposase
MNRTRAAPAATLALALIAHRNRHPHCTWHAEETLYNAGVRAGEERVRKLMAQHGIRARHIRKYIATTNSNHNLPVAPNLLERNFTATASSQP